MNMLINQLIVSDSSGYTNGEEKAARAISSKAQLQQIVLLRNVNMK